MSIATLLEDPPDLAVEAEPDFLYEVVDDEIKEIIVGALEADLANELHDIISAYARPRKLGRAFTEVLFRFGESLPQRRPDVAFVSAHRWSHGKRYRTGNALAVVPDLAVEVLSPTEFVIDVGSKIDEYFSAGIRQVWIVWPERRQIYVFKSKRAIDVFEYSDTLSGDDIIPGFTMPLSDLFQDDIDGATA